MSTALTTVIHLDHLYYSIKKGTIMESYQYLLDIAIILLSTKVLGLLSKKFQMPQVVGALLGGLFLGPAMLGLIKETELIHQIAEIGVIVLMFCAGLETDIKELGKAGKASFIIAVLGVLVPLAGGFGIAYFFNRPGVIESASDTSIFLQNMFIGVIITATSVSITVETLKEIGKLNTRAGNAILGAAIIDDVLGIIALTIITSFADSGVNLIVVLLKIAGFFLFSLLFGLLFFYGFKWWTEQYKKDMRRFTIISFVFCLFMSYIAEKYFGVADITGAYIAGLIISNSQRNHYIASRFDTLSYIFLSPIFFASVGLKVILPEMSWNIILFAIILVAVATLTKIIGCGIGAKVCGYTNKETVQIGMGMISRGEVALIVASKGAAVGLMSSTFLGPIIVVVVATTIIAPILLKLSFRSAPGSTEGNRFAGTFDELENYQKDI